MGTEEGLPGVVSEVPEDAPIEYVVHRLVRPRAPRTTGLLSLFQIIFYPWTVQDVRQPLFKRIVVELLDERLSLFSEQDPGPSQASIAGGAGWSASIITSGWNLRIVDGIGAVEFKTVWATDVSRAIGVKTQRIHDGTDVGVQGSGPMMLGGCLRLCR